MKPFNMLIVGMTNCGKTYYMLKMIETEYLGHFEHIVIVCPTFWWNQTYQEWKYINDDNVYPIACNQDDVDETLGIVKRLYRGTNTLVIVDDCAASSSMKGRTGEIVDLAFSARHYCLSVIVVAQQLTSISKSYRENITKLVTFYNSNMHTNKAIAEQYLSGVPKEELNEMISTLRNNPYARLEIEMTTPFKYKVVIPHKSRYSI